MNQLLLACFKWEQESLLAKKCILVLYLICSISPWATDVQVTVLNNLNILYKHSFCVLKNLEREAKIYREIATT